MEILQPKLIKNIAKGIIARGAAYSNKPKERSELNSKPPVASPNLLVKVSIKTVDLYFSFVESVVNTASLAGLFKPYSKGRIVPCKIKNKVMPEALNRYSEKYPDTAKNATVNKTPYIVKTNLIPRYFERKK